MLLKFIKTLYQLLFFNISLILIKLFEFLNFTIIILMKIKQNRIKRDILSYYFLYH
jgi:hypothetical protein